MDFKLLVFKFMVVAVQTAIQILFLLLTNLP